MLLRAAIAMVAVLYASVAQSEEPQWLKDARAREGKKIATRALKSKDNWLSASVPAKVDGDIVKEGDSYSITFNIGGDSPIYCEVVPTGFDMADMVRRTYKLTMKKVDEIQGKVEAKNLEFTDAGAHGSVPYMQTRWLYRVNDGKESRVGGFKQVAFEKHGHGVYCAHVDLGYVKTFDTVWRALAQTFEAAPVAAPPYYFDISAASLAGRKIGVVISRLERDADGDTKASQMTALFLPGGAGELRSQDALHIQWVRPDGVLINASHFVSQNGDLVTNLELKHAESGWIVQGENQGKTLEAKLPADAQPGSWIEQATALRKILATANPAGAEHRIAMWLVIDPTKLTDSITRMVAKKSAAEYTARASAGAINADLILDVKSGMLVSADFPMGPQTVHVERVFESGAF